MSFEVRLEAVDKAEAFPANFAHVAALHVDLRHVPPKGLPVDEGFLTEVTFRRFFPRVTEADVSEGNIISLASNTQIKVTLHAGFESD